MFGLHGGKKIFNLPLFNVLIALGVRGAVVCVYVHERETDIQRQAEGYRKSDVER